MPAATKAPATTPEAAESGIPAVYKAIAQVAGIMSKEGISKSHKNQQQGYVFRGIDDVYNSLAPHLSAAGLVILPRVLNRECTERQTAKGGVLFNVVVEVEFDFVAAADGSIHTVKTYGEAMDSADKATNKAMSAAYKYAAMQAFCIPTEGDNDADASTPPPLAPSRQQRQAPTSAPARRSPEDDRAITIATARKRCREAGLTADGAARMVAELGEGKAASFDQLPDAILKRLATTGVSEATIHRWNTGEEPEETLPLADQSLVASIAPAA